MARGTSAVDVSDLRGEIDRRLVGLIEPGPRAPGLTGPGDVGVRTGS